MIQSQRFHLVSFFDNTILEVLVANVVTVTESLFFGPLAQLVLVPSFDSMNPHSMLHSALCVEDTQLDVDSQRHSISSTLFVCQILRCTPGFGTYGARLVVDS